MTTPLFSIIVTTKNEEKNIENCLCSISHQNFPAHQVEIIVVDNNSNDKTKLIAKKYTKNIFNKGPERSKQRNFGMLQKSKGEWLIYLDADMILGFNVLRRLAEQIKTSRSIGYYIPEIVLGHTYWGQVRRFERSFYDGTAIDCVRAIKRDVFIRAKGFDSRLTGPEDWDLDKKIRSLGETKVLDTYDVSIFNQKLKKLFTIDNKNVIKLINLTNKAVIFHNESSFNIIKYLKKKKYYSNSFQTYIDKWGKKDKDVKKQFSFCYRYFRVFYEQQKYKKLICSPILTVGMLCLRFLVGLNYFLFRKK